MVQRLLYTSAAEKKAAYRRRKRHPTYFRHGHVEWATPPALFAALDAEFHFALDVAATTGNVSSAYRQLPAYARTADEEATPKAPQHDPAGTQAGGNSSQR